MGTQGVYHNECEGYHKYTGGVQYIGYTMSTLGDTMSTPRDFGTKEKGFFFTHIFATMQLYMLAFGTSDSLLKFLSGSQSLDPNTFLVSSLIKSL